MKQRNSILGIFTVGIFAFILISVLLYGNLAKSSQPRIDFEEEMWDFGTLGAGEKAYHTFKFRNSGEAKLYINKIDSSCACTATLLSSTELDPQETGELRVEFNQPTPKNVPRTVKIYSTDSSTPVKTLTIKAAVVQPYDVKPSHLSFNTDGVRELEVYTPVDLNLQLTRVETSTEHLSAVIREPERIHSRIRFRVEVNFLALSSANRLDEQITIHTNRAVDPIIVPVRVRMKQNIQIHPNNLFFGAVSRREKTIRSAFISMRDGSSGIERIEDSSQVISTHLVKEQDTKYAIVVQLNSDAPLGRFQEQIRIQTNDPKMPLLELAVYGIVLQ